MAQTELTQAQAQQLADEYLELAKAIRKYRDENFNTLSEEERKRLRNFINQMLNEATDFTQRSIVLLLSSAETKEAVGNIVKTTKNLKAAIKTLEGINKILKVAAAAIDLAIAVASGNPVSIVKAIEEAISTANS